MPGLIVGPIPACSSITNRSHVFLFFGAEDGGDGGNNDNDARNCRRLGNCLDNTDAYSRGESECYPRAGFAGERVCTLLGTVLRAEANRLMKCTMAKKKLYNKYPIEMLTL